MWIAANRELPPKDGYYFISDELYTLVGVAKYDGYGFMYDGHYVHPDYWQAVELKEKRYGPIGDKK